VTEKIWCGTTFRRVGGTEVERDAEGAIRTYMPQDRYEERATTPLNSYGMGPFCRLHVASRTRESGVYVVTVDDGVRYVGEAEDLAARWGARGYGSIQPRNCYRGGQPTNCKINALVLRTARSGGELDLFFSPVAGRKAVEARLISELRPPWNGRVSL
jgi:hypothetical protein